MTALTELLARVEAATGGDRELDGTLWWTIDLSDDERKRHDPFGTVAKAAEHYGSYGAALGQFFDSSNPSCLARIAFGNQYTSSIDAALALVERLCPGSLLDLTLGYEPGAPDKAWPAVTLRVYPPERKVDGKSYHARIAGAPTPALAILAALLKALIAQEAAP